MDLPVPSTPPTMQVDPGRVKPSYGQILRSSAIVGGASVVSIALGIVRTKILALLLGPSGVGLIGLYTSIFDLVRSIAGMGISSSGVRQIAESVGSENTQQIGRTVVTLRRVALILGLAGAAALFALCGPVTQMTFGNRRNSGSVALLSVAVLFAAVSSGQTALVQGMRRIGDLARLSVLGALFGTIFSIPIVYVFGERGIALFLVAVAAAGNLSSWWYARKIKLETVSLTWHEVAEEASGLLKLGFAFMASGLMSLGAAYLVRVFILRQIGADAAGFYQAAWMLSGLYVGTILQAMGTDFFPRLTAVANDDGACNRLVNEQTEIGLLIAAPGILATLTLAPLVIHVFYSASFEPAIDLLRWHCLGMFLRVASFPMGYIILARGQRGLFLMTETLSNLVYVALIWGGVSYFGLVGTGMAFFGMYLFCWLLVFCVVKRVSRFAWSPPSIRLGVFLTPLVGIVFVTGRVLPPQASLAIGLIITLGASYYSLKTVASLFPADRLPSTLRRLLTWIRMSPTERPPER
jgi:PST family polysaccharide transporter